MGYEGVFEERDLPLQERNIDDLYEFVTRSPVPEPLPRPEIEDVERRFGLGALLKIGVKVGKKIASVVHKGKKASNAVQSSSNNNNSNSRHHKRSKIGNKFKNFFKKVGNGVSFLLFLVEPSDHSSSRKQPRSRLGSSPGETRRQNNSLVSLFKHK
jgi:hypothetical protein